MARILFAWELGGGLGHLNPMLQVARALQKRGHQVFMAIKDLSKVQQVARSGDAFMWFQAPVWLPPLRDQKPIISYAETLFFVGFLDPAGLLGLVRGWHALFAAIQPDLLICDYAPVSLLSSRAAPFKRVTLGNGYFHPPSLSPIPSFYTGKDADNSRLIESEARVLDTANQVLKAMGQQPMQYFHQLFDVDGCLLACWKETDHYPDRPGNKHVYVGLLAETVQGQQPVWPKSGGKRFFAYLNSDYVALDNVLERFSAGPSSVLAYVPGLSEEESRRHSSDYLSFASQPVKMKAALAASDAVICHGGGTTSMALLSGLPVLCLPKHEENRIMGERIAALGCGICLSDKQVADELESALWRLGHDAGLMAQAMAFRARHSDYSGEEVVSEVVRRCEALLAEEL